MDNPPLDAVDPDEWKTFFEQFGKVEFVTVALNNSELLAALAKRRVLLQKASYQIKDNKDEDLSLQQVPTDLEKRKPKLFKKLQNINDECRNMLTTEYPTSAIFITFQSITLFNTFST